MTIEERLDRLTERHEALTQVVELMAAENRDRDRRWEERERRREERERRMDQILGQMAEGIASLLRVAEIHEHRISRLEGQS